MGNSETTTKRSKKKDMPVTAQSSNQSTNIAHGTVLSNVPGISAPPVFSIKNDKDDRLKLPHKDGVIVTPIASRKSQIDTLPRHTAGSAELIANIVNNREKANLNKDDSDQDLFNHNNNNNNNKRSEVVRRPKLVIPDKNDSYKNLKVPPIRPPRRSEEDLTQYLEKLQQSKPDVKKSSDENQRKFIPNDHHNHNTKIRRRNNLDRQRRSFIENDSGSTSDDEAEIEVNKNVDPKYQHLHKKKDRLVKDLLSLNQIENDQKLKILEQERQLRVQNMKLNDALFVKKSLTNFNPIEESEEEFRPVQRRPFSFKQQEPPRTSYQRRTKSSLTSKNNLNNTPMRFPTIVTKYEPNRQEPLDLYLETTEDLVDSSGRVLSSKQSFKYIGKTNEVNRDDLTTTKPKVLYEQHLPVYDMHSTGSDYPRGSTIYSGDLQKLKPNHLGNYEVINSDVPTSRYSYMSHRAAMDHKYDVINVDASPVRPHRTVINKEPRKIIIDSRKSQLDDNEIREILRIVEENDNRKSMIPTPSQNNPSKYGIHSLYSRANTNNRTPSFTVPHKQKSEIHFINENFGFSKQLPASKEPYEIKTQNKNTKNVRVVHPPNHLNTDFHPITKPNTSDTTHSDHIYNTNLSDLISKLHVNNKPEVSTIQTQKSFDSYNTSSQNTPLKQDFYNMGTVKSEDSNFLNSQRSFIDSGHSSTAYQDTYQVELSRKAVEEEIKNLSAGGISTNFNNTKTMDLNTKSNDPNKLFLNRLAYAKNGDLIIKEVNEDIWDPTILSSNPQKSEFNANDTSKLSTNETVTGSFDWRKYLEEANQAFTKI